MRRLAIVILIVFIFTLTLAGYKTFLSLTHPIKYKDEIVLYSNKFNLDPAIVSSVINVESGYNKNAVSNKEALGLMQIKLTTARYLNEFYKLERDLTKEDLFDENTNIFYGCLYLYYLQEKFENIYTALASYNAGETVVRSWLNNEKFSIDKKILKDIPYKETKNYIIKIKSNLKFYRKIY